MKIIYVAGYGRSGSTVLDALLGTAPGVVGAGEVANLARLLIRKEPCTCGEPLDACPVWADAAAVISDAFSFDRLTRGADSRRRQHPATFDAYRAGWRAVFEGVRRSTDSETIVDSSKTTRLTRWRALRLAEAGCEVHVVHLVRSPAGVVDSALKGRDRDIRRDVEPGFYERARAVAATLWGYRRANRAAVKLGQHPAISTYQVVRCEEMSRSPAATAERILTLAGSPSAGISAVRIPSGHAIAGNRARLSRTIDIRSVDIPDPGRLLGAVLGVVASRRYD